MLMVAADGWCLILAGSDDFAAKYGCFWDLDWLRGEPRRVGRVGWWNLFFVVGYWNNLLKC